MRVELVKGPDHRNVAAFQRRVSTLTTVLVVFRAGKQPEHVQKWRGNQHTEIHGSQQKVSQLTGSTGAGLQSGPNPNESNSKFGGIEGLALFSKVGRPARWRVLKSNCLFTAPTPNPTSLRPQKNLKQLQKMFFAKRKQIECPSPKALIAVLYPRRLQGGDGGAAEPAAAERPRRRPRRARVLVLVRRLLRAREERRYVLGWAGLGWAGLGWAGTDLSWAGLGEGRGMVGQSGWVMGLCRVVQVR